MTAVGIVDVAARLSVRFVSSTNQRSHLPRLTRGYYIGFAVVHWTMTVENRATGWLDESFHARWREAMLHSLVYHELVCPAYCLMPDHAHVIWMGCSPDSNQQRAVATFRTSTNRELAPLAWQKQAFDHVLREEDRLRGAFQATCCYVMENPVRKGLAAQWKQYPFVGALVPGLGDLNPRREDFWDVFWKIYLRKVNETKPRTKARGYESANL